MIRTTVQAIGLIVLAVLAIMSITCKHSTEPVPQPSTDTTSHSFIWRVDTIGAGNGSGLNDVAIINDTLIYAVGEIYLKDSLGQFEETPHNLARWNGRKWDVLRASTFYHGNWITPPLYGVIAFSPTDIWLTSGIPMHGDGQNWIQYHLFDMGVLSPSDGIVRKIWGFNGNDLYFAGWKGTVVHYDGSGWRKIDCGTTIDMLDIYGAHTDFGPAEILALASYSLQVPQGLKLCRISNGVSTEIKLTGLPLAMQTIWFVPGVVYYGGGDGLYSTSDPSKPWSIPPQTPQFYVLSIRGNESNDIIAVGSLGQVAHYNGATWRTYSPDQLPYFYGNYFSCSISSRTVAAVGNIEGAKAIAVIGRR